RDIPAVKGSLRPPGKRQHFEVASDDDIRPGDGAQRRAEGRRRGGNGDNPLREATVMARAQVNRPNAVDIGRRLRTATEAGEAYLRATRLEHQDTATDRRIGEIVHEIQHVQHWTSLRLPRPLLRYSTSCCIAIFSMLQCVLFRELSSLLHSFHAK